MELLAAPHTNNLRYLRSEHLQQILLRYSDAPCTVFAIASKVHDDTDSVQRQ